MTVFTLCIVSTIPQFTHTIRCSTVWAHSNLLALVIDFLSYRSSCQGGERRPMQHLKEGIVVTGRQKHMTTRLVRVGI